MKKAIFILGTCLTLMGCKDHSPAETVKQVTSAANSANPISNLIGRWQSSAFFYGSDLTLNEDGSFQYHYQGCLGHKYSAGSWKLVGQGLILTSYDTYQDKPVSQEVEPILVESVQEPALEQATEKPVKLQLSLNSYDLRELQPITVKLTADTTEYFAQQVLIVKNDSLYWLNAQGKEGDAYGKDKR